MPGQLDFLHERSRPGVYSSTCVRASFRYSATNRLPTKLTAGEHVLRLRNDLLPGFALRALRMSIAISRFLGASRSVLK